MVTKGDVILDTPGKIGGKGLFVKELEMHYSMVRPILRQALHERCPHAISTRINPSA